MTSCDKTAARPLRIASPDCLDADQARQVLAWRGQGWTWRAIAWEATRQRWGAARLAGNQFYGEELCYVAAVTLGLTPEPSELWG